MCGPDIIGIIFATALSVMAVGGMAVLVWMAFRRG